MCIGVCELLKWGRLGQNCERNEGNILMKT